jgi:hypothetical protein
LGGGTVNFKILSLGNKVVLGSGLLALVSMFLKWADFDYLGSVNGFQNYAFVLLALFAYPLIFAFKNKSSNKLIGVGLSAVGIIATFLYYTSYGISFFGTYINLSSTGLYLFSISLIGLLIGTVLQKTNTTELEKEEEIVEVVEKEVEETEVEVEEKKEDKTLE